MIRAALLFATFATAAHAADLPRESRVPGGIALIDSPGGEVAPTALIDVRRAAVIRHDDRWLAIVGIALSTHSVSDAFYLEPAAQAWRCCRSCATDAQL